MFVCPNNALVVNFFHKSIFHYINQKSFPFMNVHIVRGLSIMEDHEGLQLSAKNQVLNSNEKKNGQKN